MIGADAHELNIPSEQAFVAQLEFEATRYSMPPFQHHELAPHASALESIVTFDPTSVGLTDFYRAAQTMYAIEKATSSVGALKGTKIPSIDLENPQDVHGLRHHVLVHAVTGMLETGVSDAKNIPFWDRDAFVTGVRTIVPSKSNADQIIEQADAQNINVLRSFCNLLAEKVSVAYFGLTSLDKALQTGQVTRVNRTTEQLSTMARVMDEYDENSELFIAKIKHLLWLTDLQSNPEIREFLLPEVLTLLSRAEESGIDSRRFTIDMGVDTGISSGTYRPPYDISAFAQLRHLTDTFYAVPDKNCDAVELDTILASINRVGATPTTAYDYQQYTLPWNRPATTLVEPSEVELQQLSGGLVHDVSLSKMSNGQRLVTKIRRSGSPAELPNMVTSADEITHEAKALRVAGGLVKGVFPTIIDDMLANDGILVMREIMPASRSLKEELDTEPSASLILRLARTIGAFHRLSDRVDGREFRGPDYFRQLLEYRFGLIDSVPLKKVISDLMVDTQGRGIILGGLSPKNILTDGQRIGLLDLETACQGNRYFDVGFNLGHLLLHTSGLGIPSEKVATIYQTGYEQGNYRLPFEAPVMARTVLGSIIYRLAHPETAYVPKGYDDDRVRRLLERGTDAIQKNDLSIQQVLKITDAVR